ncbi:hypothetical protein ACVW00_003257 [Marmoricola sp. URHA0025 HA25]
MIRRVSLATIVAIGAVWVLATFVLGLWGKTAAADRLTGDLQPAFSNAGVHQASRDAATVDAFTAELQKTTIPFLAEQLHAKPQDVTSLLASRYPAVGKVLGTKDNDGATYADGRTYLQHASGYLDDVTAAVKANQDNFRKASDIPASFLPTKAVAWLFLVLGLAALALGGAAIARPALVPRIAAGTAALGIVVIAVTFALGVPAKTGALDDLTADFRPVFTTQGPSSIVEGQRYLAAVRAADAELETKVVPALPTLLKTTPDAVATALQAKSPVVAAALLKKDAGHADVSVLGGIVDRFDALAGTVDANIADFRSTDRIPGLGWPARSVEGLLVIPALVLLVCAGGLAAQGVVLRRSTAKRLLSEVSG